MNRRWKRVKREAVRRSAWIRPGHYWKAAVMAALCALVLCGCGKSAAVGDAPTAAAEGQTLENGRLPEEEEQTIENGRLPEEEEQTLENSRLPEEEQTEDGQIVSWEATVEDIGTDFFIVSEIFTDVLDDGSMIAVVPIGDTERKMTEVAYTDQTVFTIRTTYENGMKYSDSEGTDANLQKTASCILKGSWEGDIFCASEVIIYNHQ